MVHVLYVRASVKHLYQLTIDGLTVLLAHTELSYADRVHIGAAMFLLESEIEAEEEAERAMSARVQAMIAGGSKAGK